MSKEYLIVFYRKIWGLGVGTYKYMYIIPHFNPFKHSLRVGVILCFKFCISESQCKIIFENRRMIWQF